MNIAWYIFTVLTSLVFLAAGGAKLAAVEEMRKRAAHVGFSVDAYRVIGALEVAGAVGLLAGFFFAPLAVAAGIGLVLMMCGAVVTHVRIGDGLSGAAPAIAVGALAALQLVFTLVVA